MIVKMGVCVVCVVCVLLSFELVRVLLLSVYMLRLFHMRLPALQPSVVCSIAPVCLQSVVAYSVDATKTSCQVRARSDKPR